MPDSLKTQKPDLEYLYPILITLGVLTLSILLHLKWCGTTMGASVEHFQTVLDYHRQTYPFSIRPFTTQTILILHNWFGISAKIAFFGINLTLSLVLGPCFYLYLKQVGFDYTWSRVGTFLLISAYPILAAHFEPVHTYDDFWVYLFTLLAFTMLVQSRPAGAILWFTLSCFAREQSFVLYPALVFGLWQFSRHLGTSRKLSYCLFPIIIYGAYFATVAQPLENDRFSLIVFNFETWLRSRDTIFSLFISFGFLWWSAGLAVYNNSYRSISKFVRYLWWGTVITLPLNTAFTLFLTNARETRILFPPYIFLIPLGLLVLRDVWRKLFSPALSLHRRRLIMLCLALLALGVLLGKTIFPYFEHRQCGEFSNLWAGIHIGLSFCVATLYFVKREDTPDRR